MDACRSDWSRDFKDWIIDLVQLSIDASIAEFDSKFYKQKNGLPTGGSLIVPIANITVFYALNHALYSNRNLMKNVIDIKRYIDDGVGIHRMSSRAFSNWKKMVSSELKKFGLNIKDSDWNVPTEDQVSVNFLDISFWFDDNFTIQTDLYQKPTDSRRYLHYSSCHPNYSFSGIVYSQGLRLRRLINDDDRLEEQLDRLQTDFLKCNYPPKLCEDIFTKIKKLPRNLKKVEKEDSDDSDEVLVISTHGKDQPLMNIMKKVEKDSQNIKFKYVKKTASSLGNMLVKSKRASLGNPYGKTVSCGNARCQCCSVVSKKDFVLGPNKKKVKSAKGTCSNRCVIYHGRCTLCQKVYVGKATQRLNGF